MSTPAGCQGRILVVVLAQTASDEGKLDLAASVRAGHSAGPLTNDDVT